MKKESKLQEILLKKLCDKNIAAFPFTVLGHDGLPDVIAMRESKCVLIELKDGYEENKTIGDYVESSQIPQWYTLVNKNKLQVILAIKNKDGSILANKLFKRNTKEWMEIRNIKLKNFAFYNFENIDCFIAWIETFL